MICIFAFTRLSLAEFSGANPLPSGHGSSIRMPRNHVPYMRETQKRCTALLDLRKPAVGTGLKMEPLDVDAGQAVLNKKRTTP